MTKLDSDKKQVELGKEIIKIGKILQETTQTAKALHVAADILEDLVQDLHDLADELA